MRPLGHGSLYGPSLTAQLCLQAPCSPRLAHHPALQNSRDVDIALLTGVELGWGGRGLGGGQGGLGTQ